MRLSWKLHAAVFVVTAAVLALQTALRLHREEALFESEMVRDHLVMGRAMRHAVEDEWDDGGEASARALVERLDIREPAVRIRLLTAELPSGAPAWMDAEVDAMREVSGVVWGEDREWRLTYVPLLDPDARGARIEIRESLLAQERYISDSARRSATWGAVLLLLTTVVIGALIWWLVLRPVKELIAHARRIGTGDLGSRVHFRSRDELGQLGLELDQMAVSLREAADRVSAEQAARERAVAQLRHADRLMTVGTLAAGVAHELGTPLNVALVRARLIERGEVADEADIRDNAKSIAEQCERMAGIIRQLLNFARPRPIERSQADLRSIAAQTLKLVDPMARKASVALALAEGAAVVAEVDVQQLQQVLINVVTNAVHASPDGGRIDVSVDTVERRDERAGRWAVLRVADQGTGMDAEQVGHIFEPFYTTKAVGVGTGLGLSVSHGIVRDHHGFIEVDSTPGEGTTFAIHLPLGEA
ncbi:MAG: HAMP domain-containing histidine kinase [Alphaproteobacteria bacterium]|nr:HAMP domain-containing histidine kinase [Alphaproteobacteria bacterium]